VDLQTGKLRNAEDDDYFTRCAPHVFNLDEPAPLWERHLQALFAGDKEMLHIFHKHLGASLVGDSATAKPQCFLSLEGAGGSGKGTAGRTLQHVLGSYAAPFRAKDFEQTSARHPQWMMRLNGTRLAIVEELPPKRLDVALIKTLSGGDSQVANSMRQDDSTWIPSHTLLFTGNNAPDFDDRGDSGVQRRYVPFATGQRQEPVSGYEQALKDEAPGILAWLVRGCLMWQKEDGGRQWIDLPEQMTDHRDANIAEHDPFSDFLSERLETDPRLECSRADIQLGYQEFLNANAAEAVAAGLELDLVPHTKDGRFWGALYQAVGDMPGVRFKSRGFRGVAVSPLSTKEVRDLHEEERQWRRSM
jgi:putative DNA primase/helicase